MQNDTSIRMREEALYYVDLGLPIIPICPPNHAGMPLTHRQICKAPGKMPLLTNWTQRTIPTHDEVEQWFKDTPYINIGLILGDTETWNMVGIDVDGDQGESLLKDWSNGVIPITWEFTTGNGRRLLYLLPEGAKSKKFSHKDKQQQGELALLATGQQTVLPPSIHVRGSKYEWIKGRSPGDIEMADAPQWLLNRVIVYEETGLAGDAKSPPVTENDWSKVVETGERNNHIVKLAGSLIARRNIPKEQIMDFLKTWNIKHCVPALPESEIEVMVESLVEAERIKASKRKKGSGAGGSSDKHSLRPVPFAEQFIVDQKKANISWRYSVNKGMFYRCDDIEGPWQMVDVIYAQKEIRQALMRVDETWDTMRHVIEVTHALRELLADPVNDDIFDIGRHPDLIHVYTANGLLDWRTSTLKPWDVSTYSTIRLPVTWDPQSVNSDGFKMWIEALEEWIPDEQSRMFLQEYIGYCLIPDCSFRTAVFLYGSGSNGKSLFLDIISMLFKGHISFIPLHRIAERFSTSYLMDRLINVCGDVDSKYMDETSVLKSIIAGDPIRGEFKHGKSFDFYPVSRLLFSANTLPRAADKSEGWYSRWKFIYFPNKFTTNPSYKRNLMSTMSTPNVLSGLLFWAIEGLRRLYDKGEFTVSGIMKKAEEEYKAENDSVLAFKNTYLEDTGHHGTDTTLSMTSVFRVYKVWCDEIGLRSVSQIEFSKRMLSFGVSKGVRNLHGVSAQCYLGMRFTEEAHSAKYHEEYNFQESLRASVGRRG